MKRLFAIAVLGLVGAAVFAAEDCVVQVQSVKYFTKPNDARFHYELPSNMNFKFKKDAEKNESDDEFGDVELDASDVQPVKKVIKKLGDTPASNTQQNADENVPMNYDTFPKFYDGNDIMQQQIMPMF